MTDGGKSGKQTRTRSTESKRGPKNGSKKGSTMRDVVKRYPPLAWSETPDKGPKVIAPDVGHQPLGQTTKG